MQGWYRVFAVGSPFGRGNRWTALDGGVQIYWKGILRGLTPWITMIYLHQLIVIDYLLCYPKNLSIDSFCCLFFIFLSLSIFKEALLTSPCFAHRWFWFPPCSLDSKPYRDPWKRLWSWWIDFHKYYFSKKFPDLFLFQFHQRLSAYLKHLWRFWIVWISLLSSALFKDSIPMAKNEHTWACTAF